MPINTVRTLLWLYWLCGRLEADVLRDFVLASPHMSKFVLAHEYLHELAATGRYGLHDTELAKADAAEMLGYPRVIEH